MSARVCLMVGLAVGFTVFGQDSEGVVATNDAAPARSTNTAPVDDDPLSRAFAALDQAEKKARAKARLDLTEELAVALRPNGVSAELLADIAERREQFLNSVNRRMDLGELRRAREQYDSGIQKLLGDDHYVAYRHFEATKNFRDEAARIALSSGAGMQPWDAVSRETLIHALIKHRLILDNPWMPLAPELDELESLNAVVQPPVERLKSLQNSLAALSDDPDFKALPEGMTAQVSVCIGDRVERLKVEAMTPEERRIWMEARMARDRAQMQMIHFQFQMQLQRFDPQFQPKLPTYY